MSTIFTDVGVGQDKRTIALGRLPKTRWVYNNQTGKVWPVDTMATNEQCNAELLTYTDPSTGQHVVTPVYRDATAAEVEEYHRLKEIEVAARNREVAREIERHAPRVVLVNESGSNVAVKNEIAMEPAPAKAKRGRKAKAVETGESDEGLGRA